MTPPLALSLARRELRGGMGGFGTFLACLALGVAAIAGIGSMSAAVVTGLAADARSLLGGDVSIRLVHRPIPGAALTWLGRFGTVSRRVSLRTMARGAEGGRRSLIELKAVDGAYPLYGALELAPPLAIREVLGFRDGVWGAAAEPGHSHVPAPPRPTRSHRITPSPPYRSRRLHRSDPVEFRRAWLSTVA